MVEVVEEKFEHKAKINLTNHLVVLTTKHIVKMRIGESEITYEKYTENILDFVENLTKEKLENKINAIEKEMKKRFEVFKEGIEILEKLGIEVEEY